MGTVYSTNTCWQLRWSQAQVSLVCTLNTQARGVWSWETQLDQLSTHSILPVRRASWAARALSQDLLDGCSSCCPSWSSWSDLQGSLQIPNYLLNLTFSSTVFIEGNSIYPKPWIYSSLLICRRVYTHTHVCGRSSTLFCTFDQLLWVKEGFK